MSRSNHLGRMPGGDQRDIGEWVEPEETNEVIIFDSLMWSLINAMLEELLAAPKMLAAGLDLPNRILFEGPSGTGKTMLARWLGVKLNLPLCIVRLDRAIDCYLGETSRNLASVFDEERPCIIFLDEVDGICRKRKDAGRNDSELARVTSSVLQLNRRDRELREQAPWN